MVGIGVLLAIAQPHMSDFGWGGPGWNFGPGPRHDARLARLSGFPRVEESGLGS